MLIWKYAYVIDVEEFLSKPLYFSVFSNEQAQKNVYKSRHRKIEWPDYILLKKGISCCPATAISCDLAIPAWFYMVAVAWFIIYETFIQPNEAGDVS